MTTYNLFVRLLDGKTLNLKPITPTVSGESIKERVFAFTGIPTSHQLIVAKGLCVYTDTLISAAAGTNQFPSLNLLLRLVGGKGGFGSLLRGAATKAGQKKTNNFDACRDMSGRRIRHVNAEKKLEEWQAEAGDRRLEKIAEEFLKKKAKDVKKTGAGESDKYVQKYREQSEKCVQVMEESVRQAVKVYNISKRKASVAPESESKKLKIWMGKNKFEDSDSEDMDKEGDGMMDDDNEKSIVLDHVDHLYSTSHDVGSSSSVSCEKVNEQFSAGPSCESGSEEDKEIGVQESFDPCEEKVVVSETDPKSGNMEDSQIHNSSCSVTVKNFEAIDVSENGNGFGAMMSEPCEGLFSACNESVVEKPLQFDEFDSATEMEGVGMERLKCELQRHGLKCGGTLQERASRLFLLKTTPLQMLPKKMLARK